MTAHKGDPGYKTLDERYVPMGYVYRHYPMERGEVFPNGSGGWEWTAHPDGPEAKPAWDGTGLDVCDIHVSYWKEILVETDVLKPHWTWELSGNARRVG